MQACTHASVHAQYSLVCSGPYLSPIRSDPQVDILPSDLVSLHLRVEFPSTIYDKIIRLNSKFSRQGNWEKIHFNPIAYKKWVWHLNPEQLDAQQWYIGHLHKIAYRHYNRGVSNELWAPKKGQNRISFDFSSWEDSLYFFSSLKILSLIQK